MKMVLLFSILILFLKTSHVCSWLAGKCVSYKVEDFPETSSCAGKNSAVCQDVTDIKEDLHGLPSNQPNLCIRMQNDHNTVLAPNSFSRFVSLEYLEISGCFSEIPPEAFNGLTNLTTLRLLRKFSKGCCEVALDFSRLPSLHTLKLDEYSLALLSPNVFEMISQLRKLILINVCLNDMSEVLCRLINVKSLKLLDLNDHNFKRLKYPNCSVFNTSVIGMEFNIEEVYLNFEKIVIEEGSLEVLGKLSSLSFFSNTDFLKNLSLSGVRKINVLELSVDVLDVDDLCTAAKLYSTEHMNVMYGNLTLTPNISNGCKHIKSLLFRNNQLLETGEILDIYSVFQIFSNLSVVVITKNVLRPNDFQSLCASFPDTVRQVHYLKLNVNRMDKIVAHQFMCFVSVDTLEIAITGVSKIEDFAFVGLKKLKELNLCRNKLSHIYYHTFTGLYELMILDLQGNPIIYIEPESFGQLINLKTFLLGDLNFPSNVSLIKIDLSDIFGIIPYNLSNVFISSGLRPMQLAFGRNSTLDRNLTFHIKGQYVSVQDCNSSLLTSVVTLKINAAYMSCGNEFIGKYVSSVVNLEFKSDFSENIGDLSVINQLVHLKTLILVNIELTKQPNVAIMFHNLTNLRTLILSNCRMFFLDGSLTKDLKALTGLVLLPKGNINIIQSFVEHLTSLKYLCFMDLSLYCSCDNAWLVSWVTNNKKVQVAVSKPTWKKLLCLTDNGNDHLNFVGYVNDNCLFDINFMSFASTSVFLCIFIITVISYKFVGQYIPPFYYIITGWFQEALRVNGKRQYRYDVFVSYSGKDEHWVMEELLPNLEQRGPPFLRLCLHSRDFQLGQDIVENITDSIYASRRTLCLVSHNYLGSKWCSLEMQLATYRLQVEHKDILILVFLEMISSRLLSSHHRLARLVKTRTYLDWPQDPEIHEAFWERLWCKLSSDKSN